MDSPLRTLNDEIAAAAQLHKELSKLQYTTKRTHDQMERTSTFKVMTGSWRATLMMVWVLTDDMDIAYDYSTFVRSNWKGINWNGWVNRDEMEGFLRTNRRIDSKWDDFKALEKADHNEHFNAALWIAEHKTFTDLSLMNAKGVTPPAHVIAELLESNFSESSRGPRAIAWLSRIHVNKHARKNWLTTFRRKWTVSFKVLPQRPPLSPEDIVHKDCGLGQYFRIMCLTFYLDFGTIFGSQMHASKTASKVQCCYLKPK